MTHVTVGRWGRNLALRFPQDIASLTGLREGDRVVIEADGAAIVIRPAPPETSLETLFAGKRPDEWRALYADAYDWGPDKGREVVEE